ncbi:NfeD family protein [Alkalithermobacter paradoxus]|uniref:NfeD-like C-terminal domain-containing protein n=1 Tax=Alkalithermobacter paradoxus TaxID=29349 RepID=A0A1V4I8K1_9FIRM|nr:hypothetical protein CLOTH_06430 [[Clostridium] thermoalcaliphilum]
MIDWLKEILVFEKIYWYLAIPFTILLIIQLLFSFSDLDSDEDFDIEDDSNCQPVLKLFTVKNLITFFAVFGWSGITLSSAGLTQFATILISTIIAVLVLLLVSALFYFISKLAANGTMDIQKAKGSTGEVYLRIPPKRSGIGKVNIKLQGSFRELDAITDDEELPRGTIVMVKGVINNVLLVEKINEEDM